MIGIIIAALVLLCVLVGQALFVTLGVAGLVGWNLIANDWAGARAALDNTTSLILAFEGLEKDLIIAIPLFTLAGSIMTHGGISQKLVSVMRALMGWLPGGLPIACIVACCFFAAISGSSAVTIIAVGGMLYPALQQAGYSRRFALGLLTACGAIGTLVVPALPLVAYSVFASNAAGTLVPVEDLYKGGVAPTLLAVGAFAAVAVIVALVNRIPRDPFSPVAMVKSLWQGFFAILMPVLLVVLLFQGYATIVETSAVAVLYAVVVEVVIYREIGVKKLMKVTVDSSRLVGAILVIMAMALSVSELMTDQEVPQHATDMMRYDRVHAVSLDEDGEPAPFAETYTGVKIYEDPSRVVIVPRDDLGNWRDARAAATALGIPEGDSLSAIVSLHRGAPFDAPADYEASPFGADRLEERREGDVLSEAERASLEAVRAALARLHGEGDPAVVDEDALDAMLEQEGLAGSAHGLLRRSLQKLAGPEEALDRRDWPRVMALLDAGEARKLGLTEAEAQRLALAIVARGAQALSTRAPLQRGITGALWELQALRQARDLNAIALTSAEGEALTAVVRDRDAYERNLDALKRLSERRVEARELERDRIEWMAPPVVESRLGFLIGVNLILLAVGCLMDIFSAIIVMAPLIVPMAQAYDVDLVHLGVIFALNLEIGFATPPFGLNLFISQSFFQRSLAEVFKATLPFLGLLLVVLAAVTYSEPLALFFR